MLTRLLIVTLLICFLGYVLRFEIVSSLQLQVLRSCDKRFDTATSLNKALPYHYIFRLKGIEKFFPHRVNSMQMLQFLYKDFSGFECDVSIDTVTKRLLLAHDDITPESNVLSDFFSFDKKEKIFWLDVKNLTLGNLSLFTNLIEALDKTFRVKGRIVIESSNLHCLNYLSSEGYLTSYYVPTTAAQTNSFGDNIEKGCASPVRLLSQDIQYHSEITRLCPKKKQLSWDLSFVHSFNKNILTKHLNDTTLLVCLLNIKAPGYR